MTSSSNISYSYISSSVLSSIKHLDCLFIFDSLQILIWDRHISQIKHDKKERYDPNLEVKIPFNYNRFQCDIYSDTFSDVNIMNINKFAKVQCDIYLDKIWKYNENFISKWKVKMIHLL